MVGVISQAPGMPSSRTFISLTTFLVAGLRSVLQRTPPRFIGTIPVNGGAQTLLEVGMLWGPTQFVVQRRRIDGVPQVVADAVGHVVEVVRLPTHHLQQRAQHGEVVALTFGADQVGPADLAFFEDSPDRTVVVV